MRANQSSLSAWLLGPRLAVDEQVQRFTSRGSSIVRRKFKKEGDGFFVDSFCNNVCIVAFYPHNQPVLSNCINLGHSPLHSCALFLLNQLEMNSYHEACYDNLHSSVKLTKGTMIHAQSKCLTYGMRRKNSRGLPSSVFLNEPTRQLEKEAMVGSTKAAALNDDKDCPSIVAFSVRDQKPAHFLSTAMEEIS